MTVSIIQTNKKCIEWLDIKGYEGLYVINKCGEIISMPRNGTILQPKKIIIHIYLTV